MVDRMKEMYAWDMASRQGNVNTKGLEIEVNEFDYKAVNEVIYQENGVTITSIPAIHAVDGSVSFILDLERSQVRFLAATPIPTSGGWSTRRTATWRSTSASRRRRSWSTSRASRVLDALNVATQVHTSPAMFGKVMSQIKPRHGRGLSRLQRLRHQAADHEGGPLDLRRAVRAGGRLHGVQRDQGRHPSPHGGLSTRTSGRCRRSPRSCRPIRRTESDSPTTSRTAGSSSRT